MRINDISGLEIGWATERGTTCGHIISSSGLVAIFQSLFRKQIKERTQDGLTVRIVLPVRNVS